MQCPSCQEDVRKSDKHCHGCGIDLQKPNHEVEATRLRAELKQKNDELEAEKAEHAKTKQTIKPTSILP